MSPTAFLVGRENVSCCTHQLLTTIVDRLLSTKTLGDRLNDLYSIVITRKHELTIAKLNTNSTASVCNNYKNLTDEGFESDIDNASLLSSDGDSINCLVESKLIQTKNNANINNNHSDSANSSSSCSDSSDTETNVNKDGNVNIEQFSLDSLVCYTNLRFPKIIGFVHKNSQQQKNEFLVFEFTSIDSYDRMRYTFNSINSAAINRNVQMHSSSTNNNNNSNKFNLLQRTDKNGVTHIEISQSNANNSNVSNTKPELNSSNRIPSSIISINTPEIKSDRNFTTLGKLRSNSYNDLLNHDTKLSLMPSGMSNITDQIKSNCNLIEDTQNSIKSRTNDLLNKLNSRQRQEIDGVIRADIDNIENIDNVKLIETKKLKTLNTNLYSKDEIVLKKVWHSAEDILDSTKLEPKKPERRRKQKGRAPPPPNVMKGQYVRVNVDPNKKSEPPKLTVFESNKLDNYNSNWNYVAATTTSQQPTSLISTILTPEVRQSSLLAFEQLNRNQIQPSSSEFRSDFIDQKTFTLTRNNRNLLTKNSDRFNNKWTNSVQRIPKKILPPMRSRSENRCQKNNPYRYIDTTATSGVPLIFSTNQRFNTNNFSTHSLPAVVNNNNSSNSNTISNRLFGLSQKLKEFGTNVVNTNHKFSYESSTPNTSSSGSSNRLTSKRRSSLGELNYKSNVANLSSRYGTNNSELNFNNSNNNGANLKSVIKKNDDRKTKINNNEKKVTFSAFATVQVV